MNLSTANQSNKFLQFQLPSQVEGPPPPRQYQTPQGPYPRPFFFYDYGGVYTTGQWPQNFQYPTYTVQYPNSVCNPGCKCGTPYPCQGECPRQFQC